MLEQENSNEETLSKANAEFVKEVYELQRAENDITIVLFQLQYLSCRLVILREHYRTAQKEHLICYSYIIGTLTYLEGMQAHCKFAYEIHPAGADVSTVPAGTPPVIWTSEVINLIELRQKHLSVFQNRLIWRKCQRVNRHGIVPATLRLRNIKL